VVGVIERGLAGGSGAAGDVDVPPSADEPPSGVEADEEEGPTISGSFRSLLAGAADKPRPWPRRTTRGSGTPCRDCTALTGRTRHADGPWPSGPRERTSWASSTPCPRRSRARRTV